MAKRQQHVTSEGKRTIIDTFTDLAKKPKFETLKQILADLRPTLLIVMEQGYTHKDIVETLKKLGYEISVVTLRKYLKAEGDRSGDLLEPESQAKTVSIATKIETKTETAPPEPEPQTKATINAAIAATPVIASVVEGSVIAPSVLGTRTPVAEAKPARPRAMLPLSPPPRTQAPAPPSSS